MNHIFSKYNLLKGIILISLVLAFSLSITSCKDDDDCTVSTIDSITLENELTQIEDLQPNDRIIVYGQNLNDLSGLFLNSTPLVYNKNSSDSITILIADVNSNSPDLDLSDSIRLVKTCGQSIIKVNILESPPYITKISNEFALIGDTIFLEGLYFRNLDSILFMLLDSSLINGELLSHYTDTSCMAIIPEGVNTTATIILTSKSGRGYSSPRVQFHNELGILSNFDNIDNYEDWGGITTNNSSGIPEANGMYFLAEGSNIAAGTDSLNAMTLPLSLFSMPSYTSSLSGNYFALKFELFVKDAWESGFFTFDLQFINTNDDQVFSYTYDFMPWEDSSINNSYITSHWETHLIPLNKFKLLENRNIGVQSYSQISVANNLRGTFINPTESEGGKEIESISLAIDNVRIVQIQSE